MFGIIRPCRHRLGELGAAWQAHLCGLCLSLRDDHGQAARLATNYDGLVISVLAEAQAQSAPERRTAGRCALRGLRKADVAIGDCARLAATVSLVLASAKIRDHADDGDGAYGKPGVRGAAAALAGRWAQASARAGRQLGFEVSVLTEAVGRQTAVEAAAGPGTPLLTVTEPTETGAGLAEARRLCDDALLGIQLALDEAVFTDDRLVRALLVRELTRSVDRTFAQAAGTFAPRGHGHSHEHAGAEAATGGPGSRVAGLSGLASLSALASLASIASLRGRRHRRGCGESCCCDSGEDCCCECSCDCCCESCCEGCDCGEACCSCGDCG